MFLKKLYRHNKMMFAFFTVFIAVFLFINFKWGMVATPVFQFGMYSGKARLSDTIAIYQVTVNNKPLEAASLSSGERDFIQIYLDVFPNYPENNRRVSTTLDKYLGFLNNNKPGKQPMVTEEAFSAWFQNKIQKMVAEPVQQLQATRQHYTWANNQLVPVDSASKLPFLDAH